ncbi:hypothetical protein ST37_00310 [Vibrio sp. qd031]|uniref:EAL domain-containing protein n=1 Tax=Vibrio sp. qd031 TaxID=1603038 RepID=UPI000A112397|nr:EAL domain-containing protein [Vibrio sp. qd031]ORT52781.1 hypothetical protein ST37_00310 [Vibrio sp. qd031]
MIRLILLCLVVVSQVGIAKTITVTDSFTKVGLNSPLLTAVGSTNVTAQDMYLNDLYSASLYAQSVSPDDDGYWYKLNIQTDQLSQSKDLVLVFQNHLLQHLDVFLFKDGQLQTSKQLGINDRASLTSIYKGMYFRFSADSSESTTVLIYKQTDGPGIMPLVMMDGKSFAEYQAVTYFLWGGAICVLIALVIYNSFVFALNRHNQQYAWYLVFQVFMLLNFAPLYGFGYLILPEAMCHWLANHMGIMHLLLLWSALQFGYQFLEIKRFRPRLARYIKHSYWVFIPLIIIGFNITNLQRMFITVPMMGIVLYICIGSAVHTLRKGYRPAFYYLLSWVGVSLGAVGGYLTYINVLPQNVLFMHAFLLGALAEQLLLSVSLGVRLRFQENKEKQHRLIDQTLDMPNQNFTHALLTKQFVKSGIEPKRIRMVLIQLEGLDDIIGTLGTDLVTRSTVSLLENMSEEISQLPWQIDLKIDKHYFGVCIPPNKTLIYVTDEEPIEKQVQALLKIWHNQIDNSCFLSDVYIRAATARIDHGWDELPNLHQKAYMAVLEAKKADKRWLPYNQTMANKVQKHIELLHDLKAAITNNELDIFIQPQVDLNSNLVVGGEALIRWNHPKLGSVSPGVFIPIAEQSGLIYSVTKYVLQRVFSWVATQPRDMRFSVNISALDIEQKDFVHYLKNMRDKFRVPAGCITLEITESCEMEMSQDCIAKMIAIKKLGFAISIDDFGTGYSSMAYLSQLDIDEVKVDIMFTRGIDKNFTHQTIVRSLIGLAAAFNANVVIEGIENANEKQTVKALGGRLGQGFYWSGAIPMLEFETKYSQRLQDSHDEEKQSVAYLHR